MPRTGYLATCLLLHLSSVACEQVSGVDDLQIVNVAKTHPDWSCIGTPSNRGASGSVSYQGVVHEIGSDRVLSDVAVRLCQTNDYDCTNPLFTTQTTSDGFAFSVDAKFNGYLELTSDGMMPAIIELSRAIGAMRVLPEPRMMSANTLTLFALAMQSPIVASDGHLMFLAEDCEGELAPGVTVTVPPQQLLPESGSYYVVNQKLPSTTLGMTDASGGGGFINLPTTVVGFEARRADNQQLISSSSARIRAGVTTFVVIEPD